MLFQMSPQLNSGLSSPVLSSPSPLKIPYWDREEMHAPTPSPEVDVMEREVNREVVTKI